ncbi:MAG: family N-acetyltransferase [Belnapia sp.]|nr:family N-acetyltransferase [Belnapia sp.]
MLLPLLRQEDGRLASLATPYSLSWQPLIAPGAEPAALRDAGRALGRLFRYRAPVRLDTLPAEAPGLAPLHAGFAAAGLHVLAYDHFGNWHEALPPGTGWDAYLAARPPALRTTIGRKLARARRELRFEAVAAPGAALEAGIAAYKAVRAASWKPHEPFPDFDGHVMRATAAAGLLRLGILRAATDGRPVAAQYWVLDRARRRATVLKLAHAEAARAGSPGTALTAMMIRGLLEDDGVTELDFGRGDDDYKRLWVGERRQRIGLLLACPLHPAGLAALAMHAAGRLRRYAAGRLRRAASA